MILKKQNSINEDQKKKNKGMNTQTGRIRKLKKG